MRLSIPVLLDGKKYTDVKIMKANSGVLAETKKEAESGAVYTALLVWVVGVVEEVTGEDTLTEKADIKRFARALPFESAWAITCFGMAETKGDDTIQGAYPCPECGKIVRAEKITIDGEDIDEADHLKDLVYQVCENPEDGISMTLEEPIEIKRRDTGEVIESIESFTLAWPSIGACIRAYQKYPDDEGKMQFSLYADCIISVNGKPITPGWKTGHGDIMFSKMSINDLTALTDEMKKYAVDVKKERVCIKCKTRWKADIDLNGFFGSGLKR